MLWAIRFKLTHFHNCSEGQQLRYCGSGFGYDDIIIKGNPDDMKVCLPVSRVDEMHWCGNIVHCLLRQRRQSHCCIHVSVLLVRVICMIWHTNLVSMQNDPVVSKASELLRLGAMPSPDELRSGKVGCKSFLGSRLIIFITVHSEHFGDWHFVSACEVQMKGFVNQEHERRSRTANQADCMW